MTESTNIIWPSREGEKSRIKSALNRYDREIRSLPGIGDPRAFDVLATQFVASIRREDYYRKIQLKQISAYKADPNHPSFDPERAVAYHMQQGNLDEAAWLIFLMTHFAKPLNTGWLRLRDVYGRLGEGGVWEWASVSPDPSAFASWLATNWEKVRGKFGNHRKYESIRPDAKRTTGMVVTSYVNWIGSDGHRRFFADVVRRAGNDPNVIFDTLYEEMPVLGFGRLGKFDYLAMIGRYQIAPINAGSAYLPGATGPAKGARLLFDGDRNSSTELSELQALLNGLNKELKVGMEIMEDALCNWQKSPFLFVHFKG